MSFENIFFDSEILLVALMFVCGLKGILQKKARG
jgi:hypothetical protein